MKASSLHRISCAFCIIGAGIALAGSTFFFFPENAWAKKMKKHAPTLSVAPLGDSILSKDPYQPESAAQIVARISAITRRNIAKQTRKGPNKSAHTLALAFEALRNHHYAEARALAKTVQNDELFADYSHWIQATAFEEDARVTSEAGPGPVGRKQVAQLAQQAFVHFLGVVTGDPHSALVRAAPKQAAISELFWADSLPPSRIAVKHYQNAFERLSATRGMSEITAENVENFAKACRKYQSTLCEAWVIRLSNNLSKDSDEYETIIKLFPDVKDRPKVPPSFSRATQTYRGADLDNVAFEEAMASLRGDKVQDGIAKVKGFLDDFPKSAYRYRARFFLAQAYLGRKQKDDAKRTFEGLEKDSPLTFYGMLSALALGHPIDVSIDKSFPLAAQRDLFLLPDELFKLNRAEIFLSEGANDLASLELRGIQIRSQLSSPFLMYLSLLSHQAQDHSTVFQLLSELLQRGYPGLASQFGLKMIFPVEDFTPIRKYSTEFDVDPILIMSLIKQESAFDVKANSGSGASGLMQLMNFTALETLPGIKREQLIEADTNVHAGTKYLSKLLDHFKGNIVLALAGYNAGPSAVDRWVREGTQEKRSMMDFIEAIPFKETREYVGSIIRNYYWYSKLVSHAQQPVTLAYFWKPYKELNHEIGTPQPNSAQSVPLAGLPSSTPPEAPDDDLLAISDMMPSPLASPSPSPSAVAPSPLASASPHMSSTHSVTSVTTMTSATPAPVVTTPPSPTDAASAPSPTSSSIPSSTPSSAPSGLTPAVPPTAPLVAPLTLPSNSENRVGGGN